MERVSRGRSTRAVAFALLALAALVASALAATGDLAPRGCIDDQPPGGPDNCTESADALDDAQSVAVSADGKSVYVASSADDAIIRFNRNKTSGALTPRGCVEDTGKDECAVETAGLDGANSVAVSADGKSVYVASSFDDAIVRFNRNKASGALTPRGCVEDTGQDECARETAGLDSALSVAVSADGKSVYAASEIDFAIVRFKRNKTSGALTPRGCIEDTGGAECAEETAGLAAAQSAAVSADGKSVYAASAGDDAIVRFKRNRTSGALTPQGCVEDSGQDECNLETAGLNGARSVAVSADGKSAYAASAGTDSAVVRFTRNRTSGALTPQGCIEDTGGAECAEETGGLDSAEWVAVSPDGKSVYVASFFDDAVVRFKRNRTSGALTPEGCIEDTGGAECAEETAGLAGAFSVAVSPDGRSVYAAARLDDAIIRFRRDR